MPTLIPITDSVQKGEHLILIKKPSYDKFNMELHDVFEVVEDRTALKPHGGWVIKRVYPNSSRLEFVYIVPENLKLFKKILDES